MYTGTGEGVAVYSPGARRRSAVAARPSLDAAQLSALLHASCMTILEGLAVYSPGAHRRSAVAARPSLHAEHSFLHCFTQAAWPSLRGEGSTARVRTGAAVAASPPFVPNLISALPGTFLSPIMLYGQICGPTGGLSMTLRRPSMPAGREAGTDVFILFYNALMSEMEDLKAWSLTHTSSCVQRLRSCVQPSPGLMVTDQALDSAFRLEIEVAETLRRRQAAGEDCGGRGVQSCVCGGRADHAAREGSDRSQAGCQRPSPPWHVRTCLLSHS